MNRLCHSHKLAVFGWLIGVGSFAILLFTQQIACAQKPETVFLRQSIPRVPVDITTKVSVDGKDRLFVVDTGAEASVFDLSRWVSANPDLKDLNVRYSDSQATQRTFFNARCPFYIAPSLRAQSLIVEHPTVAIIDLHEFSDRLGWKLDGILGMPALSAGIISLNYDKRLLEIHAGPWRLNPSDSHEMDLEKDMGVPIFDVQLGGHPVQFLIDTGDCGCVSLETSVFEALVKEGWIEVADTEETWLGAWGRYSRRRGWFLKGELMGRTLVGVSVCGDPEVSLLGLEWLYGFNTEIDFTARKFRYQKRSDAPPPMDSVMMIGAGLTYGRRGALVEKLWPKTGAAANAGLKNGDVIEAFDGLKSAQMNSTAIAERVAANAGKTIKVRFLRKSDGAHVRATLRLPPPISPWNFAGREFLKKK